MRVNFGSRDLIASETYDSATSVAVDIQSYAIEVQPHNEDTIKVEIYHRGFATAPDPVISCEADTVRVQQKDGIGINLGGGQVLISVPAESVMDYSLQTVSGSARLALDNVSGYQMTYQSVSGAVKDDYHEIDYAKHGVGKWGDESLKIDIQTTSGSMKLIDWRI